MVFEFLAFSLLTGVLSGFLAGLVGIGGGVVIVPALYFLFRNLTLFSGSTMQVVIATSLAVIIINSALSSWGHWKRNAVQIPSFIRFLPGLIIGSLLGILLVRLIDSTILKLVFALFEILFGMKIVLDAKKEPHKNRSLPSPFRSSLIGVAISLFSALLGIGGGVISVPVLSHFGLSMTRSVGTASLMTLAIALFSTLSFSLTCAAAPDAPWLWGYVYMPAFVGIGSGAFLGTPLGVRASHALQSRTLKRIFGGVLMVIGLVMLLK